MTIARVIKPNTDSSSSDSFLDDEASEQESEPREFADITHGTVTYRIGFGTRDLQVGSVLYPAIAAARGPLEIVGSGKQARLTFTLPIDHALARRYLALATPPKKISFTLWRKQVRSDLVERLWEGRIVSMQVDDQWTESTFNIESYLGAALMRVLPTGVVGKDCTHRLYNTGCGISRDGTGPTDIPHKITTTVISVSGRDVRVDLAEVPADDDLRTDWAALGELVHVLSGERMTIRTQTDPNPGISTVADLSMQAPIYGMQVGHSVEIYAGCKLDIVTCSAKFANKNRFGGFPQLPTKNPFVSVGTGPAGDL